MAFSLHTDPYINLGFEEWLLRKGLKELKLDSLLYLYRNRPSVVCGRFQVPWREVNFKSPYFSQIEFVRRRSGGGTVYHDLGNWNFCFFHRGRELKREENLEVIKTMAFNAGVKIDANERHDLLFKGMKVSGSAFKQTKDYCYHHGTLLVEAKLKELKGLLGVTTDFAITGKGIASVPSPVTNLREHGMKGEFSDFVQNACAVLGVPWESVGPLPLSEEIRPYSEALKGDSWRWGETPRHEITIREALSLEIEKGVIIDSSLYKEFLVGKRLFSLRDLSGFSEDLLAQKELGEDLGLILLKKLSHPQ